MIWFEGNFGDVSGEVFVPVMPSSLEKSKGYVNTALYQEKFTMIGIIKEVMSPKSKKNRSKTQYEYYVAAVGPVNSHKMVRCIIRESFGDINDHEYFTLKRGARVIVTCTLGDPESGVILGGIKNTSESINEQDGHFWVKRFSSITQGIDKDSVHYVKHDSGNAIQVHKDKIVIMDGQNNTIVMDQTNKKIIISDGSGESITFDQTAKTITVQAKDLNLNITGNLTANVKGNAKVNAKEIQLNGAGGQVVTTKTHQYDYITGIKIPGVKDVKAG